jgi:hypothetical protein
MVVELRASCGSATTATWPIATDKRSWRSAAVCWVRLRQSYLPLIGNCSATRWLCVRTSPNQRSLARCAKVVCCGSSTVGTAMHRPLVSRRLWRCSRSVSRGRTVRDRSIRISYVSMAVTRAADGTLRRPSPRAAHPRSRTTGSIIVIVIIALAPNHQNRALPVHHAPKRCVQQPNPLRDPAAAIQREIEHLLTRRVGRPSQKPKVFYHSFQYQAKSWQRSRRMVAKIEWHRGELFPRVGFIVTNLTWRSKRVVRFYNGRGTAEQWIKEGKNAVKWTKLSCRTFRDNQARLQLFALTYNLGNFLRRLALPKPVRHWSLTTLREKLIKIGAKVTRHTKYVTFQLAEVAVTRNLFAAILNRIARLAIPPPILVGRMPA